MTGRVERYLGADAESEVVFRNAWIPNFRERQVGDGWVLSNDAGGWALVTDAERSALDGVAIPLPLFRRLAASHLLLTEANTPNYWESYARWTQPHFRHPVHHIVITTKRCNLACAYCHVAVVPPSAGKGFDLSEATADAILDFMAQSNQTEMGLEFQGGESLLNGRVLRHFIEKARSRFSAEGRRLYISVQTNATLIDDEWMTFFLAHEVRIGTSLDGPAEIHDAGRPFVTKSVGRQVGSHRIVQEKVERFRLPTLPTIHRHSLPAWREIVDAQLATGNDVVAFQSVYPINNAAKNWADVGLEPDAFQKVYAEVVAYLKSLWRDGWYPLERRFQLALRKLVSGRDVDFADFGNPCGMVHSQIAYDVNGDIFTCDEGRDFPEFKIGNVATHGYSEVVFGKATQRLKALSIPNDPECRVCAYRPYCSTCPVYDRAKTGELTARHAGTDKCKSTKFIFDTVFGWADEDPELIRRVAKSHGL